MQLGYQGSTHHHSWLVAVEQRPSGEVGQDYNIAAGAGSLEADNLGAEGTVAAEDIPVLHLDSTELGLAVGIATWCEMRWKCKKRRRWKK